MKFNIMKIIIMIIIINIMKIIYKLINMIMKIKFKKNNNNVID